MGMNAVREAIESLYEDSCDVIEKRSITDPVTKKTNFEEVTIFEGYPCKLSFSTLPSTSGENTSSVVQSVKLFISPDISIKPGSKITVKRQDGSFTDYASSGKPAVYASHQEIALELFERWS